MDVSYKDRLRLARDINNRKLGKYNTRPMEKERWERLIQNQVNRRFKEKDSL